ncbi:hypothetical protein MLD38_016325 [Melastoma candidum]|uniref:Uncharacterized protein n=1 Tax=Melastoma candidum TaxID=119954 RepID=A0ACB9RM55_9MYRT|nr:hypothetical protein MLD38_016325 [Melastoma candidum]
MGCSQSKSSVSTGNTNVANSKKPAAPAADYPNKVEKEESVILQKGDVKVEGQEGAVGVTVVLAETEKKEDPEKKLDENVKKEEKVVEDKQPEPESKEENGENATMKNEEGLTKEAEPAPAAEAPPAFAKLSDVTLPKQANPPEKKEE